MDALLMTHSGLPTDLDCVYFVKLHVCFSYFCYVR